MDPNVQTKIDKFFSPYIAQKIAKSTVLIYPNENPRAVHKLDSGRVVQYDIALDGTRIVLNVFKPPAFFPMSWAINNTNDNYFYETHGECTIRRAPAAKVLEFIKNEPDVMLDLLSRLYSGISGSQRRNVYSAKGSALQRITYELLLSISRFGEQQDDGSYALPFSEPDLAANSGLTRETVNREIAKMKKLDLVKIKNKKLYIPNQSNLEQYLKK